MSVQDQQLTDAGTSEASTPGATLPACLCLTRHAEQLIHVLQHLFVHIGRLPGIDIYLQSAEHGSVVFVRDGEPVLVPMPECPHGRASEFFLSDCFQLSACFGMEIAVRSPKDPGLRLLMELLVRQSGQRVEAAAREESLLTEAAGGGASPDLPEPADAGLFRSGQVKGAIQRLIHRLAALKTGVGISVLLLNDGRLEHYVSTRPEMGGASLADLGPLRQIFEDSRVLVLNQLDPADRARNGKLSWHGATSLTGVSLSVRSELVGCMVVWLEDATCEFDSSFSRLVETFSRNAARLLEGGGPTRESERLAHEIEIGAYIQERLFGGEIPQNLAGIEFDAFSLPARQLDGNLFDFYPLNDGWAGRPTGNVMSKGVAAALLGLAVKKRFSRILAGETGAADGLTLAPLKTLQRAAQKLNEQLIKLAGFVTLCFARFYLPTGELQFAGAGHTNTIVDRKSTGKALVLRADDGAPGNDLEQQGASDGFQFIAGDTFLFYSDGLAEQRNQDGETFGERLLDCVETWSSLGPQVLIGRIQQEASTFHGFSTDSSCLALRIALNQGAPLQIMYAEFPCELAHLASAREWLEKAAGAVPNGGFSEDSLARLQLACGETLDNCIVHGAEPSSALPMQLESWIYPDSLTVHLRHKGSAFDPSQAPPPSFDGSRENGFGLYITSRSADHLAYSREADGTNLISISILRKRASDSQCK